MTKKLKIRKRVKFQNPPINELVVAVYHLPLLELKAQHIGIYWASVRDRYPNCDQQPPISFTGLPPDAPGEVFPLPRFWFHSGPGSPLVQIQRDAFIFNWRSSGTNEYPHYEAVVKQFADELAAYRAFVSNTIGRTLDVVSRCELTYINIISANERWKEPQDVGNVFPPLASLSSIHSSGRMLVGLNSTSTYRFSANLMVDSAVRLGKRADTQQLAAVLEIKAHGSPPGLSMDAVFEWYDAAHDATGDMFLNFTDKAMQNTIWKPI